MSAPLTVTADKTLEQLDELFEEHPFLGLPVVDEQGNPLGVVSRAAVAEAALNRSEQESLARQRMSDELRSMPTWFRSRRRLAWLSSNIVLNIIAASVISAMALERQPLPRPGDRACSGGKYDDRGVHRRYCTVAAKALWR